MEKISLQKCQGYLWYSDSQKPRVFIDEPIEIEFDEQKTPLVIEGQLFAPDASESFSIKYADGQYFIHRYSEGESNDTIYEGSIEQYIPNVRLELDDKVLYFARLWEKHRYDEYYEFSSLKPLGLIFKGFGRRINEKKND